MSVFGDVIFDFTLIVWVALFLGKGQSWAPLAASGVGLAAHVSNVFIWSAGRCLRRPLG